MAEKQEISSSDIFTKENVVLILKGYYKTHQDLLDRVNKGGFYESDKWALENIFVCQRSLRRAIKDAIVDIDFLLRRRNPSEISLGKLAGCFAFRLTRSNPIQFCGDEAEDRLASKYNAILAHAFCRKFFLCLTDLGKPVRFKGYSSAKEVISDSLTNELIFTMTRRHMNQETLALVYDTISHYACARIALYFEANRSSASSPQN